jgi:ribose transport system substrate-binding protein
VAAYRTLLASLFVAVALVGTVACGGDDDEPSAQETTEEAGTTTAAGADQEPVRIAHFMVGGASSFAQAQADGAKEAAKEAGNATVKVFDPEFDPTKQLNQIQDALASGNFDAFLIHAADANVILPTVKEAIAKDIKVVAVFNPMGPDLTTLDPQIDGITSTVASSIPGSGEQIGQMIVDACGDKNPCKVAFEPCVASLPLDGARLNGVKSVLSKHAAIDVVSQQDGQCNRAEGLKVSQNILQANSDLDVIATAGDQSTLGAEQAVKSAGKAGKIALIGNGASRPGVEAVQKGRWFGTVVLLPFTEGKTGAELLIKAVRGEDVPNMVDSAELSPIGPVVTADNAADFEAQWDG